MISKASSSYKIKNSWVILCAALVLIFSQYHSFSQETSSCWVALPDMPVGHQYHAAVASETHIYVVGGTGMGGQPPPLERYDPLTGQWETLASPSITRYFPGAAYLDNRIYLMGGVSLANESLSDIEVYDIEKEAWQTIENMPSKRDRLAAVVMDHKIYVIGGMQNEINVSIVEVFDPKTSTWEKASDLPFSVHGHSAVVHKGLIYVFGGYRYSRNNETAVYDPKTDAWQLRSPMLHHRGFMGAAEVDGKIYTIAGRTSGTPVECYDPQSDSWEKLHPMPGGFRNRFGIATHNDIIYVLGGEYQGNRKMPLSAWAFDPKKCSLR